jgi:hypothetical protein
MLRTSDNYTRHLLAAADAVCLDGSPGAYYFRPGAETRKFYVHYEGGGWCTDLHECAGRATELLGSSKAYPASMVPYQDRGYFNVSVGYFSTDPKINPMMYNWSSVFLRYCDGTSFTGARLETSGGLHFRGSAIRDAQLDALRATHGLADATDVVVGGASAGGLSAYLHADRWRAALASTRVTALPDSGFFLETDSTGASGANGLTPGKFASSMGAMVAMANATAGLPAACVGALGGEAWRCVFAQEAARHLATPTFALQSAYDSWQLTNEMAPNASADAAAVNAYGARVRAALGDTLLASARHGAFLESCEHHCFAWGNIAIDGDVQAAAFAAWYAGARRVWNQSDAYPCAACCHGGGR